MADAASAPASNEEHILAAGTVKRPKPRSDRRLLSVDVAKTPSSQRSVFDKKGVEAVDPINRKQKQGSFKTETVIKGVRRGSWEMVRDPAVGTYFYNYRTDESTWDAPAIFSNGGGEGAVEATPGDHGSAFSFQDGAGDGSNESAGVHIKGIRRGPWEEVRDPSVGKVYYYNHNTKVSQWDSPKEFKKGYYFREATRKLAAAAAFAGVPLSTFSITSYSTIASYMSAESAGGDGGGGGSEASQLQVSPIVTHASDAGASASDATTVVSSNGEAALFTVGTIVAFLDPASGCPYYFDTISGESRWDEPPEVTAFKAENAHLFPQQASTEDSPPSDEGVALAEPFDPTADPNYIGSVGIWHLFNDPSTQCCYYWHSETGSCQWEVPSELAVLWEQPAAGARDALGGASNGLYGKHSLSALTEKSVALPQIRLGNLPSIDHKGVGGRDIGAGLGQLLDGWDTTPPLRADAKALGAVKPMKKKKKKGGKGGVSALDAALESVPSAAPAAASSPLPGLPSLHKQLSGSKTLSVAGSAHNPLKPRKLGQLSAALSQLNTSVSSPTAGPDLMISGSPATAASSAPFVTTGTVSGAAALSSTTRSRKASTVSSARVKSLVLTPDDVQGLVPPHSTASNRVPPSSGPSSNSDVAPPSPIHTPRNPAPSLTTGKASSAHRAPSTATVASSVSAGSITSTSSSSPADTDTAPPSRNPALFQKGRAGGEGVGNAGDVVDVALDGPLQPTGGSSSAMAHGANVAVSLQDDISGSLDFKVRVAAPPKAAPPAAAHRGSVFEDKRGTGADVATHSTPVKQGYAVMPGRSLVAAGSSSGLTQGHAGHAIDKAYNLARDVVAAAVSEHTPPQRGVVGHPSPPNHMVHHIMHEAPMRPTTAGLRGHGPSAPPRTLHAPHLTAPDTAPDSPMMSTQAVRKQLIQASALQSMAVANAAAAAASFPSLPDVPKRPGLDPLLHSRLPPASHLHAHAQAPSPSPSPLLRPSGFQPATQLFTPVDMPAALHAHPLAHSSTEPGQLRRAQPLSSLARRPLGQ